MRKLYTISLALLVGCASPTVKNTAPLPPLPPGLKPVSRAKAVSPKLEDLAAPRVKAVEGPAALPLMAGFQVSREMVVVVDGQAVNSEGRVTNVVYQPAVVVRFTNSAEGTWRIERSTNLVNWALAGHATPFPVLTDLLDAPCAFYRCILYPPPGTKLFPVESSDSIQSLPPPRPLPKTQQK